MADKSIILSKSDAIRIALASQGLHQKKAFGSGRRGVLEAIRHLGYVQIDTISVTERAHNHILWSRVPDYKQKHLLDLQRRDRSVFEYWAHAAAYLPIEDYRYCLPRMEMFRNHKDSWPKSDRKLMQEVLARIRGEGPLMSRDFISEGNGPAGAWWDWKPAKIALQRLFFNGDVIISHREGFQRVYDVPERVLPTDLDTSFPDEEAFSRYLVRNAVRAHGLIRPQEAAYLRKGMGGSVRKAMKNMQEEGLLTEISVKGVPGTFHISPDALNERKRLGRHVRLLSPFDNAVIQRSRLRDLFDFDYQIEVYVPAEKRKYGYYCLPVLVGDRFVGRIDVKADRKTGTLRLVHVHVEDEKRFTQDLPAIAASVRSFADFNQCQDISVQRATPVRFTGILRQALKEA